MPLTEQERKDIEARLENIQRLRAMVQSGLKDEPAPAGQPPQPDMSTPEEQTADFWRQNLNRLPDPGLGGIQAAPVDLQHQTAVRGLAGMMGLPFGPGTAALGAATTSSPADLASWGAGLLSGAGAGKLMNSGAMNGLGWLRRALLSGLMGAGANEGVNAIHQATGGSGTSGPQRMVGDALGFAVPAGLEATVRGPLQRLFQGKGLSEDFAARMGLPPVEQTPALTPYRTIAPVAQNVQQDVQAADQAAAAPLQEAKDTAATLKESAIKQGAAAKKAGQQNDRMVGDIDQSMNSSKNEIAKIDATYKAQANKIDQQILEVQKKIYDPANQLEVPALKQQQAALKQQKLELQNHWNDEKAPHLNNLFELQNQKKAIQSGSLSAGVNRAEAAAGQNLTTVKVQQVKQQRMMDNLRDAATEAPAVNSTVRDLAGAKNTDDFLGKLFSSPATVKDFHDYAAQHHPGDLDTARRALSEAFVQAAYNPATKDLSNVDKAFGKFDFNKIAELYGGGNGGQQAAMRFQNFMDDMQRVNPSGESFGSNLMQHAIRSSIYVLPGLFIYHHIQTSPMAAGAAGAVLLAASWPDLMEKAVTNKSFGDAFHKWATSGFTQQVFQSLPALNNFFRSDDVQKMALKEGPQK